MVPVEPKKVYMLRNSVGHPTEIRSVVALGAAAGGAREHAIEEKPLSRRS